MLSDPHERAWYDAHRDALLFGHAVDAAHDGPDGMADELLRYFSPGAYTGFSDAPGGFYRVYGGVFARIAERERLASDAARGARDEPLPAFGAAATPFVGALDAFYREWGAFSSCLSFAWCDVHDTRLAPNRQIRRRIERENQSAREQARRAYSQQVCDLVAFVRKRDPRVAAHVARTKEQQGQSVPMTKARTRARAPQPMPQPEEQPYEEPEWASVDDLLRRLDELEMADRRAYV